MVIKLKTEEGLEFSFGTVDELMDFQKQMGARLTSKETENTSNEDTSEDENDVEVGDKVRIVSSEDGTDIPYHYLNVGSVGKVVGKKQFGGIVVEADGRSQCLLPHHYVKLEPLGKEDDGEGEGELLTVGTKVRLLSNSICGDLNTGDEGTITDTDEGCPMDFVYSVRVRSGVDGYGWVRREDVEVVEDEKKFRIGDIVKVTETFEDSYGDDLYGGDFHRFGEPSSGRVCISSVFVDGDNIDKIELVCRAQDRLDKY